MPQVDVYSLENKKVGTIELQDSVFSTKVNIPLVHQVIKAQRAGKRQGTACTKTRSEVRGTTKKPYKQKGTGNARHGSLRSPIFVGGGVAFGPKPRSFEQATPKKMIKGALCSVLTDKLSAQKLIVLDSADFSKPQTKELNKILKDNFKVKSVLLVDVENKNLILSGRNIAHVDVLPSLALNPYDVLNHEWLFMTKKAAEEVQGRLAMAKKKPAERKE
jgi:large subunit ribosomal protein L4